MTSSKYCACQEFLRDAFPRTRDLRQTGNKRTCKADLPSSGKSPTAQKFQRPLPRGPPKSDMKYPQHSVRLRRYRVTEYICCGCVTMRSRYSIKYMGRN